MDERHNDVRYKTIKKVTKFKRNHTYPIRSRPKQSSQVARPGVVLVEVMTLDLHEWHFMRTGPGPSGGL